MTSFPQVEGASGVGSLFPPPQTIRPEPPEPWYNAYDLGDLTDLFKGAFEAIPSTAFSLVHAADLLNTIKERAETATMRRVAKVFYPDDSAFSDESFDRWTETKALQRHLIRNWIKEAEEKAVEAFDVFDNQPTVLGAIGSAAPSVGLPLLLGAAAGVATANPAVAAGTYIAASTGLVGGSIFDEAYREHLHNGIPHEQAERLAAAESAVGMGITILTSYFPGLVHFRKAPVFDRVVRQGVINALKQTGLSGLAEGTQEFVEGAFQDIAKTLIRYDETLTTKSIYDTLTSPDRSLDFIAGAIFGGAVGGTIKYLEREKSNKAVETFEKAAESYQELHLIEPEELSIIAGRPRLLHEIALRRLNNENVQLQPQFNAQNEQLFESSGAPVVKIVSSPDLVTYAEKRELEFNKDLIDDYRENLQKGGSRIFVEPSRLPVTKEEFTQVEASLNKKIAELEQNPGLVGEYGGGVPTTVRGLYLRDLHYLKVALRESWNTALGRNLVEQTIALLAASDRLSDVTTLIPETVRSAIPLHDGILSRVDLRPLGKVIFPLRDAKEAGFLKRASELTDDPTEQRLIRQLQKDLIQKLQGLRKDSRLSPKDRFVLARILDQEYVSRVQEVLDEDNDTSSGAKQVLVKNVKSVPPSDRKTILQEIEQVLSEIQPELTDETQLGTIERLLDELRQPKRTSKKTVKYVEGIYKKLQEGKLPLPWGMRAVKSRLKLIGWLNQLRNLTTKAKQVENLRKSLRPLLNDLPPHRAKKLHKALDDAKSADEITKVAKRALQSQEKFLRKREISSLIKLLKPIDKGHTGLGSNPKRAEVLRLLRPLEKDSSTAQAKLFPGPPNFTPLRAETLIEVSFTGKGFDEISPIHKFLHSRWKSMFHRGTITLNDLTTLRLFFTEIDSRVLEEVVHDVQTIPGDNLVAGEYEFASRTIRLAHHDVPRLIPASHTFLHETFHGAYAFWLDKNDVAIVTDVWRQKTQRELPVPEYFRGLTDRWNEAQDTIFKLLDHYEIKENGDPRTNLDYINYYALDPSEFFAELGTFWVAHRIYPEPKIAGVIQRAYQFIRDRFRRYFAVPELAKLIPPEYQKLFDQILEAKNQGKEVLGSGGPPVAQSPEFIQVKIDKSLLNVLSTTLYREDTTNVIIKELVQNSVDAIHALGPSVHPTRRSLELRLLPNMIELQDHGVGMTPEVVRNVLLTIGPEGGSHKVGSSVGGYGLASVLLFASAQDKPVSADIYGQTDPIYIRTVAQTPQGKVLTILRGTSEEWRTTGLRMTTEKVPDHIVTGTTVRLVLKNEIPYDEEGISWYFSHLISRSLLPISGRVRKRNGQLYNPIPSNAGTVKKHSSFQVPGATIEFWHADSTSDNFFSIPLPVLNQGLYQFQSFLSTRDLSATEYVETPDDLTINIVPNVPIGHQDYPFNSSRDSLKDNVWEEILQQLKVKVFANLQKSRGNRLREIILNSHRIQGVVTQQDLEGRVVASTPIQAQLTERLAQREYVKQLYMATTAVLGEIELDLQERLKQAELYRTDFIGFFLASFYGINLSQKVLATPKNLMLLNFFTIIEDDALSTQTRFIDNDPDNLISLVSSTYLVTILHELAHSVEMAHDVQYVSAYDHLLTTLLPRFWVYMRYLEPVFKEMIYGKHSAAYREDQELYERTVKAPSTTAELFRSAGSLSEPSTTGPVDEGSHSSGQTSSVVGSGLGAGVSTESAITQALAGPGGSEEIGRILEKHPKTGNDKINFRNLRKRLEEMNIDDIRRLNQQVRYLVRRGRIERGLHKKALGFVTKEDVEKALTTISRYKERSELVRNLETAGSLVRYTFDPVSIENQVLQISQSNEQDVLSQILVVKPSEGYRRSMANIAQSRRFVNEVSTAILGIKAERGLSDITFARYMRHKFPNGIERGEAMWAYALSTDSGRSESLFMDGIVARGKSFDVEQSIGYLSDKDKAFVDYVKTFFVNSPFVAKAFDVFAIINGYRPETSERWFTSTRERTPQRLPSGVEDISIEVNKTTSALMARTEHANQPFVLDGGFISAFFRVVDRLSDYAEMGLATYRAEKLLTNPEFRKAFVDRFGEQRWLKLGEYINNLHGFLGHDPTALDRAITTITLNWQLSVIALNVASALRQVFSVFTAAADTIFDHDLLVQAIKERPWTDKGLYKRMVQDSGMAYMRLEAGKFTESLMYLGDRGQLSTLALLRDKSFVLQKIMDRGALAVTWRAAELMAKRRRLSGVAAREFTSTLFEVALTRHQATTSPVSISELELYAKRHPVIRPWISLQRELNRQYNVARRLVVKAIQRPSNENAHTATRAVMLLIISNAILSAGVNELRRWIYGKPSSTLPEFAVDGLIEISGLWYLMSDVVGFTIDTIRGRGVGDRRFDDPVQRIVADMIRGFVRLGRGLLTDESELLAQGPRRGESKAEVDFIKSADYLIGATSAIVGLPFWAIWSQGKGLYNWTREDLRLMQHLEVERLRLKQRGEEKTLRSYELQRAKEKINKIHRLRERGSLSKEEARKMIVDILDDTMP